MLSDERVVRVVDIEPLIARTDGFEMGALNCITEEGDSIVLYNAPLEITKAIARILREELSLGGEEDYRDSIFDVLIMVQPKLTQLEESISRVVIDGFNRRLGTYSASIYMEIDGISLKRTVIPSHAIFIALLFNKPIYVTEKVVEISKELEKEGMEEEDEEEDLFDNDFLEEGEEEFDEEF